MQVGCYMYLKFVSRMFFEVPMYRFLDSGIWMIDWLNDVLIFKIISQYL